MRRPNPGRILAALRSRLSSARYVVEDVLFVVGRFLRRIPVALGRGARTAWLTLSPQARERLAAALGALALALLLLALVVPNLPCAAPGGDRCPPPDDAEELVPSDALGYVRATLDSDGEQYDEAREIAASAPVITQQIAARAFALLPGPGGSPPDFVRDLDPWLGDELAVASLPGRANGAQAVQLLEIEDSDGAASYAEAVAAGRVRTEDYEGAKLRIDARGVATTRVEDFLVVGPESGVRAVVATASGAEDAQSLAEDEVAREARELLPDHRVVEAYLSPEGADAVAAGGGTLGSLAPFLSSESTRGVAGALSAGEGEVELAIRSVLDAERTETRPGFFAAFAPFDPELPERLPDDALAYAGLGDPERTVTSLLAQATAGAPGIAAGFESFVRDLRRSGDIDLVRELLPALGNEAAFALLPRDAPASEPGPDAEIPPAPGEPPVPGEAPAPPPATPTPFLEFLASGVDEDASRKALARLQGPVARAVDPSAGQAPVFRRLEFDGVEARSLRISPAVELTYAIFDDLAALATDPAGIEELVAGDGGLDGSTLFDLATAGFAQELALLAFFDLGELVSVAEQLGLAADPAYAAFAGEIRTLRALGIAVESEPSLLTTDARLIIERPSD